MVIFERTCGKCYELRQYPKCQKDKWYGWTGGDDQQCLIKTRFSGKGRARLV